jgi:hypothetical protein
LSEIADVDVVDVEVVVEVVDERRRSILDDDPASSITTKPTRRCTL